MRRSILLITAVAATLTLAACAGESPRTDPSSSRPPLRTSDPAPIGPAGTPTTLSDARWNAIRDDLQARGVSGAPELISAEDVVFSDGSLGCPSPGTSYIQSIIDGTRAIVRADGADYDYRFGGTDTPTLCTR